MKQHLAPQVQALDVSGAAEPVPSANPVQIHGARNEWLSFAVQLTDLPPAGNFTLRLRPPHQVGGDATMPPAVFEASQLVAMPVDVNRAGYVRHTGLNATVSDLPRALLPVAHRDGAIDLRPLRRESVRTRVADNRPAAYSSQAPRLWIDLHVPPGAPAGDYTGACELFEGDARKPVATLPFTLTVYDFVIPEEPDLRVVSRLSWESLTRLYPDKFENVTPRLMSRNQPNYANAVRTLDQLMVLARRHRLGLFVPRLQPTVKWPVRESGETAPAVQWDDYDQLVAPWLGGAAFGDGAGLSFWPLPAPDHLGQFDRPSQLAWWSEAARHFEQNDWLKRAPVWLDPPTPGRARPADAAELSQRAGQILRLHKGLHVALPLEDDQLHLSERDAPEMIDLATANRLLAAAPGLVFSPPTQAWPDNGGRPQYWLRTDLQGLVPYAGAGGDQRDLRLWAWLAFLRNATLINFGDALPDEQKPSEPADPNETIWFYPGHWFGLDEPVPTVQLKWLRRAQQDYQYLRLAKDRGEIINALLMARLITKPVEIQPGQMPDPAYALMCGTSDAKAWDDAHRLLARTILLRRRGYEDDRTEQQALYLDTLRWAEPLERPIVVGRTVRWLVDNTAADARRAGAAANSPTTLSVRLGIDIYNASDNRFDRNLLRWTAPPSGWEVQPQPSEIPAMAPYVVRRETLDAGVHLAQVAQARRKPVEVTFTNGFTNQDSVLRLMLPVAACERLEGRRVVPDGRFDEWDDADLIHDGPLVQMLSRPAVQHHELRLASTPSRVYTAWAEDNFYFAFALQGITPEDMLKGSQNFVDYELRRAWGEDLAAVVIQPVFADNSVGPVLHVVCKPTGLWVEKKLDAHLNANPWQPLEATGVRYKAAFDGSNWRGEVAVPWRAICDADRGVPTLLRFNFSQHRHATGESASWAGPVDFGRDDSLTGVLVLRSAREPGMGPVAAD